jgi:ribonucleoside-triphosphate reductase
VGHVQRYRPESLQDRPAYSTVIERFKFPLLLFLLTIFNIFDDKVENVVVNEPFVIGMNKHGEHYQNLPTFLEIVEKVPEKAKKLLGLKMEDPLEFLARYDSDEMPNITIDPNANIGNRKSTSNRVAELAKPWLKLRGLQELYQGGIRFFGPDFSLDPIFKGQVYIHDSTKLDRPYCIGVSALDIILDGRPYADIEGVPPKHFDAFMGQVVEYIMNLSMEFAGAVAVSDWVICMAWYAEKENIPMTTKNHNEISIKQTWQHAVHILHNKYRIDGDPPYTNISLNSPAVIRDMFNGYIFPDGKTVEDLMPTIMKVQKTIADFMYKGDPTMGGLQYKFPVMTCNFKPHDVGTEWWTYIARLNHKGVFNICHAEMFSSCCRMLSDVKRMLEYKTYSNGSGGIKIGSHRVVAMNLPGLAHECKAENPGDLSLEDAMYHYSPFLHETVNHAAMYLFVHKIYMMVPRISNGYYTFFSQFRDHRGRKMYRDGRQLGPWLHPNMLFSTIGVHGSPNAVDILLGGHHLVLEPEGIQLQKRMLQFIVDKANALSDRFHHDGIHLFFNVEQVPAESASHTMASFYGDELYSNQFVPLDAECDIWDRVRIEGECASILTGGSMTFLSLGKEMTPIQSEKFHRRVMLESGGKLNNWCASYGQSVCKPCRIREVGRVDYCPKCGRSMSYHERVVGYMVDEDVVNHPRLVHDIEKRHQHVF